MPTGDTRGLDKTARRLAQGKRVATAAAALIVLTVGCIVRDWVHVTPLTPSSDPVAVATPVKAHLTDGSTIVYRGGATIGEGVIRGNGVKYGLDLAETGPVEVVPLDQVAALESFQDTTDHELTALASTGVTATVIVGGALLAKVLFGSCPTVYVTDDGEETLQAELFSHSIAPSLEARDVDGLHVKADRSGLVRLEIRNEALETHYLNELELVEVRHDENELVVPDENGEPLALGSFVLPVKAIDRSGRDLLTELSSVDGIAPVAEDARLAELDGSDLADYIDLQFQVPEDTEGIALVVRARSSLLGTILFYDEMLAGAGARSIDWLGRDLLGPEEVMELDRWYKARMGMRIGVIDGGELRSVARVPDPGPIAWRDVAVVLPVSEDESLRVRLSFVPDNWRIDQVRLATSVRRPETRTISPAAAAGEPERDLIVAALQHADHRYLQTKPGERLAVLFDAGPEPVAGERSFLLSSQGYYTEWLRAEWVAGGSRSAPFVPGDDALIRAITRWRDVRDDFEKQFHETRLAVSR